jgi:pimeloyl-ACP methyl ester carboxylesterase
MTACAPVPAPPTPAADRFLVVNGTRLRYRDEGCGPAVLLVHGWTLDLEMWDPQVGALRNTFRLIRLDRRGHGLSDGVPAAQQDGEDLGALCNQLGLNRVALVGMSQGTRSALAFACAAPHRISALILDGPPALEADSDPEVPLQRYAALVRKHGIDAFRSEWTRHALMQLRTEDPGTRALLAAMIARYPGNDLRHPASATELPSSGLRLESLPVPALILSGEHDLPGRRQAAKQLAARLPDAELAVIPGAGHLPNLDTPDTYSKLCRGFITRHSPRDTA